MPYTVEESDIAHDRKDLLCLLDRNFDSVDPLRFDWLYKNNTAVKPICFVLKTDQDEIVGMNGVLIRELKVNNEIIPIACAIDLLVDKKHRTIGPALQLQRVLITKLAERGIYIIFGFPLPAAQLVLRRAGYRSLGVRQRWSKPLNSYFLLKRYMPGMFAKYLAPILDATLLLATKELFTRPSSEYNCNADDVIDQRFDALWNQGNSLINAMCGRSSRFLNWRFLDFPKTPFKIFTLTDNTDKLLGYIIYRIDDGVATISDFYTAQTDSYKLLLFEFSRHMRKAKLDYLSVFFLGSSEISLILKQCGFLQRPEDSVILLYIDKQKGSQYSLLRNSNSWFITDADKDV